MALPVASIALTALNVGLNVKDYNDRIKEGQSGTRAAVSVAANAIAFGLAPGAMMGIMAAKMLVDVAPAVSTAIVDQSVRNTSVTSRNGGAQFGGHFNDTQTGFTMRQRGSQGIQNSVSNIRNALGGEAKTFYLNGR